MAEVVWRSVSFGTGCAGVAGGTTLAAGAVIAGRPMLSSQARMVSRLTAMFPIVMLSGTGRHVLLCPGWDPECSPARIMS